MGSRSESSLALHIELGMSGLNGAAIPRDEFLSSTPSVVEFAGIVVIVTRIGYGAIEPNLLVTIMGEKWKRKTRIPRHRTIS